MKATLQILMLLLSAGCALAALIGFTGFASASAFFSSDIALMLYTVVGSMLIGFNDYTHHQPIIVRTSGTVTRPVAGADDSRQVGSCGLRERACLVA